jgi:hypothetical protein
MPIPRNQKSVKASAGMPRIFSCRLQCGGEGALCGRGQGSHGQSARVERQV